MKVWSTLRALVTSLLVRTGSRQPKTFVRWLCLRAFVYLSLIQSRRLCRLSLDQLSQAVELGVFLNRCFDGKREFCGQRYRGLRRGLPEAAARQYLRELRSLETQRAHGSDWYYVYLYRRGVLRVSLDFLFSIVGVSSRPSLLEVCSMIQLVDDVLDQKLDRRLSLPTFLFEGGPEPAALARKFWSELREKSQFEDLPFLLGGGVCYLFTRAVILCYRTA